MRKARSQFENHVKNRTVLLFRIDVKSTRSFRNEVAYIRTVENLICSQANPGVFSMGHILLLNKFSQLSYPVEE
jgi:hypothetical protein